MNESHTSNNWYPPACDTDFAFQLPITPNDYTSTFQVAMPASQSNSGRLAHRRRASCAISIIQESPAGHVPCPPQPCPSRSLSDSMLVVKPGRECITSFDNEANTNTRQWPMDIRTWWKPSHANEKPPYSYATLIAHAILCSAHGKLTLSDIYRWISEQYPYYALGSHGWQNSIRHNLSLNKRSFVKLERRPSKQNPGKGSYWAIIPGAERPFIENLTRKGGPRRHHQSTLPLGAQFAVADTPQGLARHDSAIDVEGESCKVTKLCSANLLITVPEDYQEHKSNTRSGSSDYLHISNVEEEEAASIQYSPDQFTQTTRSTSPLYTTFRMSKVEKEKPAQSIGRRTRRSKKRKQRTREDSYDSDCDSGVDVSNEYIGSLHKRKQRRKLAKEQADIQKAELSHENPAVIAEEDSNLELSWRNMLASGLELLCPDQPGFDLYSEFSYLTNAEGEGADYFSHCPPNAITRPLDIDLSLQHPLQKEALDKQDQNNAVFASKNYSSMLDSLPVGMHKTKQMSPDLSGVTFAQLLQSATVDDETSKYLKFESSDDEETSNSTDSYCVTPPSLPLDDLYPQLH